MDIPIKELSLFYRSALPTECCTMGRVADGVANLSVSNGSNAARRFDSSRGCDCMGAAK